MITLKTLKSVTFAVMLSLLAFFMYNFQPHENSTIEKNPKIENIQKIQNLSVNDANQFTVDRIKVEFERGTSEADKAALRLAFSQDLDIQVFQVTRSPVGIVTKRELVQDQETNIHIRICKPELWASYKASYPQEFEQLPVTWEHGDVRVGTLQALSYNA